MRGIALYILFTCFVSSSAQTVVSHQPVTVFPVQNPMTPLPILDLFARKHPGATPLWGIKGRHYVVRYVDPATQLGHMITYDRQGRIIRREDEINLEDCPAGLQAYYLKNFSEEGPRVWCYEEGQNVKYYIRRQSRVVWFDKEGNYIGRKVLGIF